MNQQLRLLALITITASLATWFPNPLKASSTNEGTQVSVISQGQIDTARHTTAALITLGRATNLSREAVPASQ